MLLPASGATEETAKQRHGDLTKSFVHSLAWTGTLKWIGQLLSWSSTIIIARLLSPGDYGIAGMAMLLREFLLLLTEFGVGSAVVAMRELSDDVIAQLNAVAMGLGGIGVLGSLALAYPLGKFLKMRELPAVIAVLSITFLISAMMTIPLSLMQKRLQYKTISIYEGIRNLSLAATVIALAFLHFGYWALVVGNIASSLLMLALVLSAESTRFQWPELKSIAHVLSFSGDILIGRIAWFSWSNADFMVAGRLFGESGLGFYSLGWNLASAPVDKISAVILSVTPGFFSAVQHEKAVLRRYVFSVTEGVALLTFPAAIGLLLEARPFVIYVLGAKWEESVVPLQFLAVCALLRSLTPVLSQVLVVARQARFDMWRNVGMAVAMPLGFIAGGEKLGITGIAASWALLLPLFCIPLFLKAFEYMECDLMDYLKAVRLPMLGCAAMALAVQATGKAAPSGNGRAMCVIEIIVGAVTYAAVILLVSGRRLYDLWIRLRSAEEPA
jgi:O-antigen/teichoic acid export membrane protein